MNADRAREIYRQAVSETPLEVEISRIDSLIEIAARVPSQYVECEYIEDYEIQLANHYTSKGFHVLILDNGLIHISWRNERGTDGH